MSPKRASPRTTSSSTLTAADVLLMIDGMADVSDKRKRDLKAAVRLLKTASARELEMIPFSQVSVQQILSGTTAAACDLGDTSFRAYRGHLRFLLVRFGGMPPRGPDQPLTPAWAALLAMLPTNRQPIRLRVLAGYCSARGVEPDAMNDGVAAEFYKAKTEADLRGNARQSVMVTFRTWNRAMHEVPGWPPVTLSLPAPARGSYTTPIEKMPGSFQADCGTFFARMSPSETRSLFDEDAAPRQLSPVTVKARQDYTRFAVAALLHQGMPIEEITDLGVLVRFENAKNIIDWHYHRAGKKVTTHLGGLSDTLRIIAKYHVKLPEKELKRLLPCLKNAKPPKRTAMTLKNMVRLRELDDPRTRACLLFLPVELMKRARELRDGWVETKRNGIRIEHAPRRQEAAWLAGIAVAIEIELHCPLRIKNLASLRIGYHLRKLDGRRSRFTNLFVPGHEVKNVEDIECVLTEHTAALLAEYVEQFRPLLRHAQGDWLFPSRDHADRPRSKGGLSIAIEDTIHERMGLKMNVHLFRAIAGALILEDDPRATEEVRMILGHRTYATTEVYYKAWGRKEASKRVGNLVSRKRKELRLVAEAEFGRRRRKSAPKGDTAAKPKAKPKRKDDPHSEELRP